VVIFFAGVFVTVFTNIENGIYVTIAASFALLLWRQLFTHGVLLGKVRIYRSTPDAITDKIGDDSHSNVREAYLPINHKDGSNPQIQLESPYPGILVFRFTEGFSYLNQQGYMDELVAAAQHISRPGILDRYAKLGDRPWNDPGPRRGQQVNTDDHRPVLRAVILDFSSVNHIDVTSVQGLIDVRNQLDRYAHPEPVEWHFASISSRWTKRALTTAGFGYVDSQRFNEQHSHYWNRIHSFATLETSGSSSARDTKALDVEANDGITQVGRHGGQFGKLSTVHGQNRPFFHVDVQAAVESAIAGAEGRLSNVDSEATSEEGVRGKGE
jgi:sodium-independent sulfate anion transporter 11